MQSSSSVRCALAALLLLGLVASAAHAAVPSSIVLTDGWRFTRGEQPAEALAADYDASAWQQVRVPHDWAISGPFDPAGDGGSGKLPWRGVGVYRTTLDLDAADAGSQVYLDFDGVMAFPKVYINGHLAGEWDYGYTSFRIDATPYVRFGQPNTVAVVADTRPWNSRWYPGAGIYRKVTLELENPLHIAHWGTRITTDGDELAGVKPGTVTVETTLDNSGAAKEAVVSVEIRDPAGKVVGTSKQPVAVPATDSTVVTQAFPIASPRLWDVENPQRYTAVTTIADADGTVLDTTMTRFGIRTFAFTVDDGFHLNGRRVQLHGVNLHHDLGPLGAAFNKSAARRQLEIMQEMGVNALRTSHNPPAPEVLDLCDEMGIVVWDEVFDKWDQTAGRHDGQPPLLPFLDKQIRSTVLRDKNHPSVVVWSHGNELLGVNEKPENGINPERIAAATRFVKQYDTTRPVAQGCHIPPLAVGENFTALDITGWNYVRRYWTMRQEHPTMPIVYSESASTVSTRGYYHLPLPRRHTDRLPSHQVNSYDLSSADWSDIPDQEFRLMEQDRFVAGEFVWTGIDYLGEPTPHEDVARSSYFGIVDLVGLPKDRYYLYRSYWRPDDATVHILPHWNWPDRVGQNVPVFVYTNGDSAELFLNGKSLGMRKKGERPQQPENYAASATVTASSTAGDHPAAAATDDDDATAWQAVDATPGQWLQLDLGQVVPVRFIALMLGAEEKYFAYDIEGSTDGEQWERLVSKVTSTTPQWGGPTRVFHDADGEARYVRIRFGGSRDGKAPAIRSFAVYPAEAESDYYAVTYDYRLRWNDVTYEPGELKAVVYKDGRKIGEQVVRTAGKARKLRLDADRTTLSVAEDELAFITVDIVDKRGTPLPLASDRVDFRIDGPGELAGVGNGNPLSMEDFQDGHHTLFNGKAVLFVRPTGKGKIKVTATADGVKQATVTLKAR